MGGEFYEEIEKKVEDGLILRFDANEYYSIKLLDEDSEITISEKALRKIVKFIDGFWKKLDDEEGADLKDFTNKEKKHG